MNNHYWINLGIVVLLGCGAEPQVKPSSNVKTGDRAKRFRRIQQKPRPTRVEQQIRIYEKQSYQLLTPIAYSPQSPLFNRTWPKYLTISVDFPPRRLASSSPRSIEETVYNDYFNQTIRDKQYTDNFIVLRFRRQNDKDGKWIIPYSFKREGYWSLPEGKVVVSMTRSHLLLSLDNNELQWSVARIKELYRDMDIEIWNKNKGLLFKRRFVFQFKSKDVKIYRPLGTMNCHYQFGAKQQTCFESDDRF